MSGLTANEARETAIYIKESFRDKILQNYGELIEESYEYAVGRVESEIYKAVRKSEFKAHVSLNTYSAMEEYRDFLTEVEWGDIIDSVAKKVCVHFERLGYRINYEHTGKVCTYLTFEVSFDEEAE